VARMKVVERQLTKSLPGYLVRSNRGPTRSGAPDRRLHEQHD
jgi:hypothetical protein